MQFQFYKLMYHGEEMGNNLTQLFSASDLSWSNGSTFVHYTSKKKDTVQLEIPAESSGLIRSLENVNCKNERSG